MRQTFRIQYRCVSRLTHTGHALCASASQDLRLRSLVESDYCKSWHDVSVNMQDRSEIECYRRWQKVVNPNLKKGGWTAEEDRLIVQLVDKYGPKKWSVIASHLPGRIDKQCRERCVFFVTTDGWYGRAA